jgi:hypothetical protein
MRFLITVFMFITVSAHAGEVIDIHDYIPPKVMPKPTAHFDPMALPAYSDEAALDDVWVRAWLLLDIDAHGQVVRFKFLNRPGYGLEPIAANEAFELSFAPARDNHDKPTETLVVWRIEWPSYWWLSDLFHSVKRWPEPQRKISLAYSANISPAMFVPCRGSGPLNLSSVHPVYRDCSAPDMTKVDVAPWIERPAHPAQR